MNDILVAKDQTVYAATTLGLAWSTYVACNSAPRGGLDRQGEEPPRRPAAGLATADGRGQWRRNPRGRLLPGPGECGRAVVGGSIGRVAGDILEWQGKMPLRERRAV